MTRIIFLGTAGSTSVITKQKLNSGGIIIQEGELQLHLDPGPGALKQANQFNINPRQTSVILASHNHINHCNDINCVIDAMTHNGIDRRGIILASKSVVEVMPESYPIVTRHHKNLVEKIISLEKNHKVGIEHIEIHAIPTEHSDESAIGFKIFFPKFTLSYSSDTKLTDQLIESLMGSDLIILNVKNPTKKESPNNLNSDDALKIISQVRPKLAILTHFGLDMLKADPLQEAREIQRITGVQTIAAKDGLVISPDGYGTNRNPIKGYNS